MKHSRLLPGALLAVSATLISCAPTGSKVTRQEPGQRTGKIDLAQVPTWSAGDLEFFLHGTLGTEVVPEKVLQAFRATYPELFPDADLSAFGALPDPAVGMPIGFSRRNV